MKRNLFDELNEGMQALRDEREGKITLKKHTIEKITAPELKSGELVELRQKLARTQTKDAHLRSALLDQISHYQRKIDSITIAHFDRVNELCTPTQEKRFQKFQAKILEPLHPKR